MANSTNSDVTGVVSYDGSGTYNGRTITAGTGVSVANGDGVSGNPTVTALATVATTYTADSGSASAAGNNLNIVGDSGITTSGSGDTVTLAADGSLVATSYVTDAGTATPASGVLTVSGGTNTSTSASGSVISISMTGGSGSGAWTLLSTVTPTDQDVEFTGLTSTYYAYKVVFEGVYTTTDERSMVLQTSSDNGSNYDNGTFDYSYAYWGTFMNTTPTRTQITSAGSGNVPITSITGTGTQENWSGEITFFNPLASNYTRFSYTSQGISATAGAQFLLEGCGTRLSAGQVDAIRLRGASGGTIAAGTFKLYGISGS